MAKAKNKKKDKQRAKIGGAGKAAKRLKAISSNPMVADIVAAALVGAAAALKDAKTGAQACRPRRRGDRKPGQAGCRAR